MKATLEFDLDDPNDRLAHIRCTKATDIYIVLNKIANEIFRPARKHGYSDKNLEELFDKCPNDVVVKYKNISYEDNAGIGIVGLLEAKFYEILQEHGVNLDDLE